MMTPRRRAVRLATLLAVATGISAPLTAQLQTRDSTRTAVLAVVDSALIAITTGNWIGLADLMLPEAQIYAASRRDPRVTYRMRTAAAYRTTPQTGSFVERGWDPEVRIAGLIAVVWVPYDIYVNGQWSHCGVDVFTMVRVGSSWRIANLSYSVEQPPACQPHPGGPPAGMKPPP
jgi:hypothetical protein